MIINQIPYPDTFIIGGVKLKGKRNAVKNKLEIPYSLIPHIDLGDFIVQKYGTREMLLKVTNVSFLTVSAFDAGTLHPYMLSLKVENITAQEHADSNRTSTNSNSPATNNGSLFGIQLQTGSHNKPIPNVRFQQLVEKVAESNDQEAKFLMKTLLRNGTVASIVGTSVSVLLALL